MNVKTLCVCISLYRILNFFYFSNIFDNLIIFFIIFSKKKIVLDFARKNKYSAKRLQKCNGKEHANLQGNKIPLQICNENIACKFAMKTKRSQISEEKVPLQICNGNISSQICACFASDVVSVAKCDDYFFVANLRRKSFRCKFASVLQANSICD